MNFACCKDWNVRVWGALFGEVKFPWVMIEVGRWWGGVGWGLIALGNLMEAEGRGGGWGGGILVLGI